MIYRAETPRGMIFCALGAKYEFADGNPVGKTSEPGAPFSARPAFW